MSATLIFILSVFITFAFWPVIKRLISKYLPKFRSELKGENKKQEQFKLGCTSLFLLGTIILCLLYTITVWSRGKVVCHYEDFQVMPIFVLIIGVIGLLGILYGIGQALLSRFLKSVKAPQGVVAMILFLIPLAAGIIMQYSMVLQCSCPLKNTVTPFGDIPNLKKAEKRVRFIRGKVIVIYKNSGKVMSGVQCALVDDIRADRIEEAKTVVWIEPRLGEIATYNYEGTSQKAASVNQVYWDITVIDLDNRLIVHRTTISGSLPSTPEKFSSRRGSDPDVTGDPPIEETIRWLSSNGLRVREDLLNSRN